MPMAPPGVKPGASGITLTAAPSAEKTVVERGRVTGRAANA